MTERKANCVMSFDRSCPQQCKLHSDAVNSFKEAANLAIELGRKHGLNREQALQELYWDKPPDEKMTIEAERAQLLKYHGLFDECYCSKEFKNKGIKRG